MRRRDFTLVAALAGALPAAPGWLKGTLAQAAGAAAGDPARVELGEPSAFDREALVAKAEALAARPFEPAEVPVPEVMERIDYDAHNAIKFKPEATLWQDGASAYPVQFFHPGRYFAEPVAFNVVEGGQARPLIHGRHLFDYADTGLEDELPEELQPAGFRAMHAGEKKGDWLAFLGASYFRTSGPLNQYGLSARGLAIDTALPGQPEEFPRFVEFWIEKSPPETHELRVHALMDSPSCTGAYTFACSFEDSVGVLMDIDAALFFRSQVERLGVAPLTSMFWYGEHNRHQALDWRPEIHDSDGLSVWTGAGERLWRPLANPPDVRTSSFFDTDPKGFGLLQRDRDFANYQDDGVWYGRRPSVWVEPAGSWGEGAVTLVEIPTDDEIYDNIVAFWRPTQPPAAGERLDLAYKLHWTAEEPFPPEAARVVATRVGRAGVPGVVPRPPEGKKFVIDFRGGPVADLGQRYDVECVVSASRGRVDNPYALKVVGTDLFRGVFDLREVEGEEPVELRAYLSLDGLALTETWLFQHTPFRLDSG